MRTLVVSLFTVLLASPSVAQTALPRDEKIALVNRDLHAILRIAELGKDLRDNRQVMLAMIDANVESMREKRADGSYRWASLQREEGGRAVEEKAVQKVESEKDLQKVTVSALHPYRVIISAPKKRNLVSANNRVYVRNVLVESTAFDGRQTKQEIPVNVWVNPGDSHGVPLPEIGRSAIVTAELGVESGSKQGVAQLALIEAKLVDDATSPYFPAIRRLLQLREIVSSNEIQRGALKTIADETLLAMPGEIEARTVEQQRALDERRSMLNSGSMRGAIAAGDATPDVLRELSEIRRMLGGTIEDQIAGRERLQRLSEALGAQQ